MLTNFPIYDVCKKKKNAPYFFVNAGIRRASPFNVNQGFCPAILLTFLLVFFTSKIYYDYIVIYHDYFM